MKPLVYLAGPISADPLRYAREAIDLADVLIGYGFAVQVPHLSVLWQIVAPKSHAQWLELDKELLRRCDVMLRMPGPSKGADEEEQFAVSLRIPVFFTLTGLLDWKATREYAERKRSEALAELMKQVEDMGEYR